MAPCQPNIIIHIVRRYQYGLRTGGYIPDFLQEGIPFHSRHVNITDNEIKNSIFYLLQGLLPVAAVGVAVLASGSGRSYFLDVAVIFAFAENFFQIDVLFHLSSGRNEDVFEPLEQSHLLQSPVVMVEPDDLRFQPQPPEAAS